MMQRRYRLARTKQRGAVLMVMLVVMIVGMAAMLAGALGGATSKNARQGKTADALVQARDALIGYALKDGNRPGELPCPDVNGDGSTKMNEDYGGGGACFQYLGRLPWKTLGLPEPRDGGNEPLWYALSADFRAGSTAMLNSDTHGQLSIAGHISQGNAAAIVFAPGMPLTAQVRGAAGANTVANYLEGDNANGDNVYAAHLSDDLFNDTLLAIQADQLFQPIEKRIAREARTCLEHYAAASGGKYPWAVPVSSTLTYAGAVDTYFGRISDVPSISIPGSGNDPAMQNTWPAGCLFTSGYWPRWRELVFYQIAQGYQPGGNSSCAQCLVVSPPSPAADKKLIVMVSGKTLPGKSRDTASDRADINNYLEDENAHAGLTFSQNSPSGAFNDVLLFQVQ